MLSPVLVLSLALLPATGDVGATPRCDATSSEVSAARQAAPADQVVATGDVWDLPTRVPDRVAATDGGLLAAFLPEADSRGALDTAVAANEAPARPDPP